MIPIRHHFTVDVEAYFQASALEPYLPRSRWAELDSRVPRATERLLALMDDGDVRGTFFVLGTVARDHPEVVRRIAEEGHEVASHGWDHTRVGELDREAFRGQVRRSRELLQELTGQPVDGFRAPTFSIVRGREWALEILADEGYAYDSSLYPVRRPGYGYAGGSRHVHTLELTHGPLMEVPPATLRFAGMNLPAGGGGSFRHLPYALTRAALRQSARRGEPATLYVHPWELDVDQPRAPGAPWTTRLRHYGGLKRTEPRLRRLFGEFRFQPVTETLSGGTTASAPATPPRPGGGARP